MSERKICCLRLGQSPGLNCTLTCAELQASAFRSLNPPADPDKEDPEIVRARQFSDDSDDPPETVGNYNFNDGVEKGDT